MKSINITKYELKKLKEYNSGNTLNNESTFYILDPIKKGKYKDYFFKRIKTPTNKYMANKLFTVSLLNDKKKILDLDELVIPEYFVTIDNEIVGFLIPKVENYKNLSEILNDNNIDLIDKIKYLKRVGHLIEKLHRKQIRFNIGDLNSDNFLIDNNDKLYEVDIDSVYLDTNIPIISYYSSNINVYKNMRIFKSKYRLYGDDMIYPNNDSDLLFYNYLILNLISDYKIHNLSIPDFYKYINYLREIGIDSNLINSFLNLYSNKNNCNPYLYLDSINNNMLESVKYKKYKQNNILQK